MGPQPPKIYSSQPAPSKVSPRRRCLWCCASFSKFVLPSRTLVYPYPSLTVQACLSTLYGLEPAAGSPIPSPPNSASTHTPQSATCSLSASQSAPSVLFRRRSTYRDRQSPLFSTPQRTLTTPSPSPPKSPPTHPNILTSHPPLVSHDIP